MVPAESRANTPATRLARRRHADQAWQAFVQDGLEPEGLSDTIRRSWRRTRDEHRIDPAARSPIQLLPEERLLERRDTHEILRLAAPVLDEFGALLSRSQHVLTFFDADGWMLYISGHPGVVEGVAEIGFRPGANWAEASAGTNGPGTALAERRPVEVFASEHFVAAWQPWNCSGAPIFAPGQAAPVAVVDITGPWQVQHQRAAVLVRAIARAIEERLRAATVVRDEVIRHALRAARAAGDGLVAVDLRGNVLAATDAPAGLRWPGARGIGPEVRAALAAALRGPAAATGAEVEIVPPGGPRLVAAPVCYEGAAIGAIVRAPEPPPPGPAHGARAKTARPPSPTGRSAHYDFDLILGASAAIRGAKALAGIGAHNDLSVVLSGESGTGKELFAHAIHAASARSAGPFVPVNCGSIPPPLVEAELFGYEAGTFTGGRREGNPGRFEDAHRGTLFLDEVSELSGPAQTALLRVLQEREVVRLGGSQPRAVDVRVVAATNKPLDEEVRAGRFRADLFYRLNVLSISIPPLRDRAEDIPALARALLADAEREVRRSGLALGAGALAKLCAYPWPGNVRELRNVLLRAAATAPGAEVLPEDLLLLPAGPPPGRGGASPPSGGAAAPAAPAATRAPVRLRDAAIGSAREVLLRTLELCSWNFARAAQQLGVSRMTLYRHLRRCGISRGPP